MDKSKMKKKDITRQLTSDEKTLFETYLSNGSYYSIDEVKQAIQIANEVLPKLDDEQKEIYKKLKNKIEIGGNIDDVVKEINLKKKDRRHNRLTTKEIRANLDEEQRVLFDTHLHKKHFQNIDDVITEINLIKERINIQKEETKQSEEIRDKFISFAKELINNGCNKDLLISVIKDCLDVQEISKNEISKLKIQIEEGQKKLDELLKQSF